ncbi:ribosome biogenesis protein [Candidatus Nitrosopumilus sediminis]|uniref:Ribosomal RNA small subunit methyltransferase Nep1 n=1 Tax=Candidatus Nitrosopumilus sediminis TaxID=1229909 RepID=K0BES3_9ARCH|nr:ribosome biogenesis protein [Candidatus Nitrosopumilus sediminis]AFS83562.1 ribosome biogenesis protein [Candidatus Nitrosopumilus sediminis]
MISLILSESSLELVPVELEHHPSIISHAQKLGKHPSEILLDNSWHFAAMKGIENELKRGRPDLVHFSILEATTIPLYLQNKMKLYVHTLDDKVISFGKNVHIPKSYHRFEGVIEKLYQEKRITTKDNDLLLEIEEKTFSQLIDEINPSKVIGFSTKGTNSTYEKIAKEITNNACIVLGGFQKGHFSDSVENKITDLYSVGDESFEGHVVIARMLYEYEKTIFM